MGEYTVEVSTSAGVPFVFTTAPRVSARIASDVHREGVRPRERDMMVFELLLEECRIRDDTPGAVIIALGAYLSEHGLFLRGTPDFVRIKDSGGTPIPEWGDMDTTAATPVWEDLEIVGLEVLPGEDQLKAGATWSMTVRATRVFPDGEGVTHLKQDFDEFAGTGGLKQRRLVSRIRVAVSSGLTLESATIIAIGKLAAPVGWVRVGRTNHPTFGVAITYPRYPLKTEGIMISEVAELGGPAGGGSGATGSDAELNEEIRDDLALGVQRVLTESRFSGSGAIDAVVADKPDGSFGFTSEDQLGASARGRWELRRSLATAFAGKLTRVQITRTLQPGGRPLIVTLMSGGVKAALRDGAFTPWRITERVELFALGPLALADMPVPPLLAAPARLARPQSPMELPTITLRGLPRDQHIYRRVWTRFYVWDALTDPLDDEAFRTRVMEEPEESGNTFVDLRVLSDMIQQAGG